MSFQTKISKVVCALLLLGTVTCFDMGLLEAAPLSSDGELDQAIQGTWKFREATCLSGTPIQWEGNMTQFERRMDLNSNHTVVIREFFQARLSSTLKGRFVLRSGQLHFTALRNCLAGTTPLHCEKVPSQTAMVSLQGAELWTLEPQSDAGACPARDVFIAKFVRR